VTSPACIRLWQVEAVRDGRLTGKDLERALRHIETCAECAAEVSALSTLGQRLSRLPLVERDQLTTQRARQRLIAALNDSVIDPPRRSSTAPLLGALSIALAAAAVWLLTRPKPSAIALAQPEVVAVHPQPGARWSRHESSALVRVDLNDGAASFNVFSHPGRRVIVAVPDGQIEDLGTVFDVRVSEGHTTHIAVSAGRVSVRLTGLAPLNLGSGESWDAEAPAPVASAPLPASSSPAVALAMSARPASSSRPLAAPVLRLKNPGPAAQSEARLSAVTTSTTDAANSPAPPDNEAARAEDDAYLNIVDLLRAGKDADARARAKAYLLRFPGGFRRVEVLNIATQGARDTGSDDLRAH
jgi:hypothetical protein